MANDYTKLAGGSNSGRLAITQYSLWLGPDHLLQIEKDGHVEKYHRFFFKDIEAFTIRRTHRQRNYSIFFVIVLALLAWGIVVVATTRGGTLSFGIPMAFTLLFLVINLVKGPTCETRLTTAVQQREIYSLRRVRAAERALNEVMNGSQASQGLMSAEEIRMRFELRVAPPIPAPPSISSPWMVEPTSPAAPLPEPPPPV